VTGAVNVTERVSLDLPKAPLKLLLTRRTLFAKFAGSIDVGYCADHLTGRPPDKVVCTPSLELRTATRNAQSKFIGSGYAVSLVSNKPSVDINLQSVGFNCAIFQLADVKQELHSDVNSLTRSAHCLHSGK
jgi:hypothetical protein